MLQDLFYEELSTLKNMIKSHHEGYPFPQPAANLEQQFTDSQLQVRRLMNEHLDSEHDMDKIIIHQYQKIIYFKMDSSNKIEEFVGRSNLRGVSRNGRCNW